MNAVPFFAQNMTAGAQVIQGAPLLPQLAAGQLGTTDVAQVQASGATSIVHLAPVGYAAAGVPSSAAGNAALLQSGAGLV